MALREAKCVNPSLTCAGHIGLIQRKATSSSKCTNLEPQEGQFSGAVYGCVLCGR